MTIYTGNGIFYDKGLYKHKQGTLSVIRASAYLRGKDKLYRILYDKKMAVDRTNLTFFQATGDSGNGGEIAYEIEIEEVVVSPPGGGGGSNNPWEDPWEGYEPGGGYGDGSEGGGGGVHESAGGGGSSGGGGIPPGPGNENQQQGINTDNLSQADKNILNATINNARANCAYRTLIDWMQTSGNITVKISNDVDMALYKPNTKEIQFRQSSYLGYTEMITHEGFHAYQHQQIYGNGFSNYSAGNAGNINIEFEQIVFQDIARRVKEGTTGIGYMFNQSHKEGFEAAQQAYRIWIDNLTNNGTSYPNLSNVAGFDADFNQHLSNFKMFGHPSYTGTNIVPNVGTAALKGLFSGTIGTECGN